MKGTDLLYSAATLAIRVSSLSLSVTQPGRFRREPRRNADPSPSRHREKKLWVLCKDDTLTVNP